MWWAPVPERFRGTVGWERLVPIIRQRIIRVGLLVLSTVALAASVTQAQPEGFAADVRPLVAAGVIPVWFAVGEAGDPACG